MNPVFTLTNYSNDARIEEFVCTSSNIYDILDHMYNIGYAEIDHLKIYVTEGGKYTVIYG